MIWLLIALLGAPALAQDVSPEDDARARELFDNGRMLYDEARFAEAIAAWEEAYRLSMRPLLLFNLGNAWERLGDLDTALDYLNRYRAYAPAEERATLERRIRVLEERLAETGPPEPEVLPAPEPVVASEPEPVPSVVVVEPSRGVHPLAVGGYSLAAVGLGVGVWSGVRSRQASAELRAVCVDAGQGVVCPANAGWWQLQERRRATYADLGFAAAAVGAGVATAIVLLDGKPVNVGPMPLSSGAGVWLEGRFR